MLDRDRIRLLPQLFGVGFSEYQNRAGDGILISSGAGIGMALMDVIPRARFFMDMDFYRHQPVDWEAVAVFLSLAHPDFFILAGWFTIDKPTAFERFARGILSVPSRIYIGGQSNMDELIAFGHSAGLASSSAAGS